MCDRLRPFSVFAISLLTFVLVHPASAQEIRFGNGAILHMSNGGVWQLRGTTMNFGGVGATAHLQERTRGRVTGGRLSTTRALNRPSSANPAGLGAEISASVDLGAVTVARGHGRHTLPGSTASIKRFYDLSPSKNNRGLRAALTYHYAEAELDSLSEPALELFKSDDEGSTWQPRGADSRDSSANTVTLNRVRSFSRWTLGSTKRASAGPPTESPGRGPPGSAGSRTTTKRLELASLEARITDGRAVRLTWRSASRHDGRVRVQRRSENATGDRRGAWTTINRNHPLPAKEGTTGYQFVDEAVPYAADTLSYRVAEVGPEGMVRYSEPVVVARKGAKTLQLTAAYPNPARAQVSVRYAVPEKAAGEEVTVRLYDLLGRQVRTVTAGAEVGRHETQLSVKDLASGTYILRLKAGSEAHSKRMTVVQ